MKKIFYRILKIFFVLVVAICTWQYNLIFYGIGQLKGQLNIILNAEPVTEVLRNPNFDNEQREKLLLVNKIRKFAMDTLGLNNSKNYTTFFDQHEKPVLWVVTGCLPYLLKAKEWWFPIIGHVEYKGFFEESKAREEELKVRKAGFETDIYNPSAWSTLGYFTDPILSNQLKRGPGRLSELIIHELTHATVFLKSNVDFNENLATFIGEKGAIAFLESTYGPEAEETKRYKNHLADETLYNEAMMHGAQRLDSLYNSLGQEIPTREKALKKYRLIAEIMREINTINFAQPDHYTFRFNQSPLPGNTEFMSFLRYRKSQSEFEYELSKRFSTDLKAFIAAYAKASR